MQQKLEYYQEDIILEEGMEKCRERKKYNIK